MVPGNSLQGSAYPFGVTQQLEADVRPCDGLKETVPPENTGTFISPSFGVKGYSIKWA